MAEEATADPGILIEDRGDEWVRYRRSDGLRWEVHGTCDRRGDCMIGAVVDGEIVRDHEHLATLAEAKHPHRLDSDLDVPVSPDFTDCCPFEYVVLP